MKPDWGGGMKVLQLANWAQFFWVRYYLPHCAKHSSLHQRPPVPRELETMFIGYFEDGKYCLKLSYYYYFKSEILFKTFFGGHF